LAKKGKPSSKKGTSWTLEFREKMLPIRQKQPKKFNWATSSIWNQTL